MNPANHDLRAWMHEIESINELHRIQGIPWDKDMGGLLEVILERSKHSPGFAPPPLTRLRLLSIWQTAWLLPSALVPVPKSGPTTTFQVPR